MIWKLLLTLAVILGGFVFLMGRWRGADRSPSRVPLLPAGMARAVTYAVLGFMLAGSGWYLYSKWAFANAVMTVQVVNANTGAITRYEARRGAIEGRGFRTLDGREVRLADVERMILTRQALTVGSR